MANLMAVMGDGSLQSIVNITTSKPHSWSQKPPISLRLWWGSYGRSKSVNRFF
ncbi:hypothetical protein [Chamaesiphon sp.]|uniref:hypothetical protein n=1 Tax=Chamaesiphon sp. TaxID=2814140 RepID=UPI003593F7E0